MTLFKAPFIVLGFIMALTGFSSLKTLPDAPDSLVAAPPATMFQAYTYGEMPYAEPPRPETTTTSTTTTVWIEPKPKSECEQALQVALNVGWPAKELATLARVLWRESRCSQGPVLNPNDPMSGSYGISQINGFWCLPTKSNPQPWLQQRGIITDCVDLYAVETNLTAALAIWRNSGWHPWGIK